MENKIYLVSNQALLEEAGGKEINNNIQYIQGSDATVIQKRNTAHDQLIINFPPCVYTCISMELIPQHLKTFSYHIESHL